MATLLAIPSSGMAQTATSSQTPPAESMQSEQPDSPQVHLRKAEEALNSIPPAAVTGENKTRINDIKQRINKLERAAAGNQTAAEQSQAASNVRWDKEVADIDRILTQLIGPDAGAASATGATGTAGAVGTTGSVRAEGSLDATAQAKLLEVRTHITAFAAAMAKGGTEQAVSANTATPPETSAAASAAGATAAQPPSTAQSTEQAQSAPSQAGQVDREAAKQHLTAARNALSEMTQLPAAAQLTGEARTQVTQLITNFNELITTNAEWRASYGKVEANLTALLGAEMADESANRAASSGTAGAVGTSGTAGALDPAIRAKLVEFRNHLDKFEQAAGGENKASDPSAAAAGTASAAAGTTTSSGGSTMSSTGSTAAGTMPPQQSTSAQASQPPAQGDQVDREGLLRHVQ
ncbi:MAG TPA: hypothetical protein VFP00_02825, partial [Burkholderiales bacterium]|nr:hypothetical protein [Burkholderiales bacterium]